jgi:hypothetical protein
MHFGLISFLISILKETYGSASLPPYDLFIKKNIICAEVKEGVVGGTTFPYSGCAFSASGTSFGGLDPAP